METDDGLFLPVDIPIACVHGRDHCRYGIGPDQ